jgi:hypothetical protein
MAGRSGADQLVARVFNRPANIAALDLRHADHVMKHRLGAPEATAGKNGLGHDGILVVQKNVVQRNIVPAR